MTTQAKSVRVLISGRVQGVWFRGWTEREAQKFGLSGWVRNCPDGRVEALFYGDGARVDAMIEACWNGPPAAKVDTVEVSASDAPTAPGFTQLRR